MGIKEACFFKRKIESHEFKPRQPLVQIDQITAFAAANLQQPYSRGWDGLGNQVSQPSLLRREKRVADPVAKAPRVRVPVKLLL